MIAEKSCKSSGSRTKVKREFRNKYLIYSYRGGNHSNRTLLQRVNMRLSE